VDLIKLSITPDFIRERTHLTWREALFGIDNELLSPGAGADFAAAQLAVQDDPAPALVELASLGRGEPTRDLVEQLAAAEPQQDPDIIRSKWLYLALAWIFEHKDNYPDPLRTVEEVYADFSYPDAVASFVRYMPMDELDLGSREANERRLYEKWKRYLENASSEYRRSEPL
jgi:hypothetical protein